MNPMAISEILNKCLSAADDWEKRPSKATSKRLEKSIIDVLSLMLGRKPTEEEIREAYK